MDLSGSAQAALMAIEYVERHEPNLREHSPRFADLAWRDLRNVEERALLLQLLEGCSVPDGIGDAQIAIARARGKTIVFGELHAKLWPIWMGVDLKIALGFGILLDQTARARTERWFRAALVLASDALEFPN